MASPVSQTVFLLVAIVIHGSYGQDTCGSVQQFSQAGFVCAFPPDCCTRLLCTLSFLMVDAAQMDIRINPCTDPATLSVVVDAGGTTIFNMSGISTSQTIPIQYGGILDTSVDLFFNSTMNSVTIGMSAFGTEIIPPTTIDISNPGCEAGSMGLPPACFATQAPPTVGPTMLPPASGPTCEALQQLAGGGNVGIVTNNCVVTDRCTTVSCNYLGLFPISLILLPCNNPPAIKFIAYNDTGGAIVFNETVTDSRRIPLDALDPTFAIIVNINHPCGQDAIVVEIIYSTIFNSTVLPPTTIPIDRSNCTMVASTTSPCVEPVTSFNGVCDAVESSLQSSASTCTTNFPDCTTTTCDLNQFNLPFMYGYTILPCTEIPSVMVFATNNGTILLNETLSDSRVETINVGPTNVSVRFIVNQSPPDFTSIQVGVNLISSDPPIDVPVFPLTSIPLDRCSCPEITCPTAATRSPTAGPITQAGGSLSPQPGTGNPGGSTTTSPQPGVNTGANQGNTQGITQAPASSGIDARVLIPAVIAAALFVSLMVVIAVAIAICVVLNRKHAVQKESISYKNLKAGEDNLKF